MATEYTNVLIDKILKPLQAMIAGEFPGINILYTMEKNDCLVITPTEDNLIGLRSKSQVRQFGVTVVKRYIVSGIKDKEMYKAGSEFVERLKRLIDNNTNYDGTTYYWHDGRMVSTLYEVNEDDPQYMDVTMECEFYYEDVRA